MPRLMKLQQNQVWKISDQYIRIVHLERTLVEFKCMPELDARYGPHQTLRKKEFCRLIKKGTLLPFPEPRSSEPVISDENVETPGS